MTGYMHKLSRRVTAFLGAGMLLQAGGCQIDTAELASGVLNSVVTNFIAGYVYGAFNLVG
jgi:hypothetical protein